MQNKTDKKKEPAAIRYISVPVPKRAECCELQLPNAAQQALASRQSASSTRSSYDLAGLAG